MKNFFILSIIFLLIQVNIAVSNENIIADIKIEGSQRIDNETILSYAGVDKSDIYSQEIGNDILKNLFETNLFSNIEIEFNEGILLISIKENPTINLVKFSGNSKINDEDLLIEISLKERSVYSRTKVKSDIERMLALYQRGGRLSTVINPKVEILENNRVNLTYVINESEVSRVSKIVIIGNESFSSSKIKSVMKTKEKTFLRILSSSDKYDPDKIEYDKQLISQFYNNNGYPNFNFKSTIAQLSPNNNNFEIIFYVDEGKKFQFGDINVISELKKLNTDPIAKNLPIKKSEIFNRSLINKSIKDIREIAEINGYSFIEIIPKFKENIDEQTVDVEISINEGPRVYVDNIEVIGNVRTVDKVVRREIQLSEGDAYNKYTINYSKDLVRSLGYFSKVDITEQRTDYPDKIDLLISVEEKNTGEASIGAGYSSSTEGSLQLGLKENNFLGRGQKVDFSASFANTRTTYDISFSEPYFNNKSLSLTTELYSNFSDPSSVNYETEDLGLGFSLGFPLAPDKSLRTKYSIFTSKVKADSNATSYERLLAGTDTVSQLGYSFNFDKRNSRYKPSSGYNIILDQDLAGLGGTSYYFKNRIQLNSYKRLSDLFIGAFKLELGSVNGYNDKYAPLSTNFRLGGDKLRGFKSGKIGPKTGTSYTGGQYYYVTSLETNIDFNFDTYDITSTIFIDAGSLWGLENPAYSSIDDEHELRASLGVNFNWDSAIGPINIIYANIIESQSTDTTDNLYFDIGYNF